MGISRGVGRGVKKNPFCKGGMGSFWNYTIQSLNSRERASLWNVLLQIPIICLFIFIYLRYL